MFLHYDQAFCSSYIAVDRADLPVAYYFFHDFLALSALVHPFKRVDLVHFLQLVIF